jgi:hypothetical protein
MRLLDIIRRSWSKFEALAYTLDYALEYDQHANIRARVARLERLVTNLEEQSK